MNVRQLTKNIGWRVQFRPAALGATIPDGDWFIQRVDEQAGLVELEYLSTGHVVRLGGDIVHEFRDNPIRSRGAQKYGFLMLDAQLTLEGQNVRMEPLRRRSG